MKETRFIAQNKEKWRESETLLESDAKDPEKLSNLFTQVIDDLSYSRTYYPNRSVRVYLNKIARQYFSIIYNHHKDRKRGISYFWLEELPQIVVYCKKELLISLIFFLGAMAIGIFSSVNDPEFARTILGDSYITMTNENIEKGDPMAIYKKTHEVEMFLGITINNLSVAFRTYVLGVFLAVGTLAMLLYNGIMVGCFQYFFIDRGLFVESALTIWLHGTLEISSIILAGGAGLTLGKGLIFPGTYSRLQSFQKSAIRSLKLMLGITPVFVVAAIIESFLTRYTDVPDALKLIIILMSASFIIGYFVVYPWLKARQGFNEPLPEVSLPPSLSEPVSFGKLKNNAEILKDTFHFYTCHANGFLSWILIISVAQAGLVQYLRTSETTETVTYIITENWFMQLMSNMFFAAQTETPLLILINSVCAALILYRSMALVDSEFRKSQFKLNVQSLIQIFVLMVLAYGLIYLGVWGIVGLIVMLGVFLLTSFTQLTERTNLGAGAASGWRLAGASTRQLFEFQAMILVLCFSFLMVLSAPLVLMYTSILQWNFALTDTWGQTALKFVESFIKIFSFNLIIPLLAAGTGYLYFTLLEIHTASHLKEAISRIGIRLSKTQKR
jgi:uncharacterized membrane protein SpoIIM required for sporulation